MKNFDKEKVVKEFGRYIREERERKGMIQAEAARKVGCSRSYYCMIESGDREIHFTLAVKICDVLDLSFDNFVKRLKITKTP